MTKTSLSICDTVNRSREEAEISTTMLKVALILGCLLSLIVAEPLEHQRFARSSSGSNSNEAPALKTLSWFLHLSVFDPSFVQWRNTLVYLSLLKALSHFPGPASTRKELRMGEPQLMVNALPLHPPTPLTSWKELLASQCL
ncbi:hypothetical protein ATANTOWER_024177 [Ataeniobius toweri]|uniref:Uncharacterized protein n=1 Tax=Ataeniobius toweri TaxID=208326 RepID=A0ABU7A446_9TELE|nr:hypothetical protein [Ataeniobius toweri]